MTKLEEEIWKAMVQAIEDNLESDNPVSEADKAKVAAEVAIKLARRAYMAGQIADKPFVKEWLQENGII